jgi:ribosomal protein L35
LFPDQPNDHQLTNNTIDKQTFQILPPKRMFAATLRARTSTFHLPITTTATTIFQTTIRTIKTKSSAKRRFKVLGNGNIKRWQSNKRHINSKYTRKFLRQKGDSVPLKGYQKDLGKRLLGLK